MANRILIVEDDPLNVKFMSVVLKRKGGFEVFASEDVDEIVRIAKECNISAILMDISLSNSTHNGQRVDGLYITKLLKSDPETAEIPVILATAHAMIGDKERFLETTKAEHYITKPFDDPDLFLREVASVVKGYNP
jgi:CheY-like chemotaxis protein